MPKYYYKRKKKNFKKIIRVFSLLLFLFGIITLIYTFFPLISWQIYFAPAFASSEIATPIPKTTVVNSSIIKSLLTDVTNNLKGVNYYDAQNWFPNYKMVKSSNEKVESYTLSIPILNIKDAAVTTIDNELDRHLVNYSGTSIPPDNGNSVVFGHSTLPQLFNPNDYKTIFANAYKLKVGDKIFINITGVVYRYDIFNILVVDPTDTSIFAQNYNDSYLTLITCTPPGTTWKRLVIKSRLEKI